MPKRCGRCLVYRLVYKKSVFRDLKRLDVTTAKRVVNTLEKKLLKNPLDNPMLKGAFSGLRKHRVGDYRVIYAVLKDEVLILRVGHRKEVYEH